MKFLKPLLALVVIAAVALLGGGALLSGKFTVVRSLAVNAPPERAYALVASPSRWKEWTVWNRRDPAMKIEYFGGETGPGSGWAWTSKSEGDGRMTLVSFDPGRRVRYELFLPDMNSKSTGELRFEPNGGATLVTWSMAGDVGGNPLKHWLAPMMDSLVGKDFDAGLANLKALAEKP